MIGDTERKILKDLFVSENYLPMTILTNRYHYSSRMIRNFIAHLRDDGMIIEYKRNYGYKLYNPEDARKLLMVKDDQDVFDHDHRLLIEVIRLFLSNHYISLNDLSKDLFISKTTAKNDMDEIKTFLARAHVAVKVDVKGHKIDMKATDRLTCLLNVIVSREHTIGYIDAIFDFLFKDNNYRMLFHHCINHLLKYDILISDSTLEYFVDYLFLYQYLDRDEAVHYINNDNQLFADFKNNLLPFMAYDENDWQHIQYIYEALILHLVRPDIQHKAQRIVTAFENEVIEKGNLEHFTKEEKKELEKIFGNWMIDGEMHIFRDHLMTNTIKKFYNDSFELVMLAKPIFYHDGYVVREDDLAQLSVYFNEIMIRQSPYFLSQVNLVILNTSNSMLMHHITRSVYNTIDPRKYRIIEENMFTFNRHADELDKQSTIVIDASAQCVERCEAANLEYILINPMIYEHDIQVINDKINEMHRRYYRHHMSDLFKQCQDVITFNHDDLKNVPVDPETTYSLDEGILVERSLIDKDFIHLMILNHPIEHDHHTIRVYIEYGLKKGSEKEKAIKIVKTQMVKAMDVDEVAQCQNIDEFFILFRRYIEEA